MNIDLSIIIVNYNSWHYLKPCLESVYKNFTKISFEIIVVDNASTDNSQNLITQHFPEIIFSENKENAGFSKANNQAIKIARGKYFFLLNADTLILNSHINKALNYLEKHPSIGILGTQQQNGNRKTVTSFSFDRNISEYQKSMLLDALYLNKFNKKGNILSNQILSVGYVNGAAMIIRRELIKKIGVLDERYFFMAEEVDFAFRCHTAGYEVVYFPEFKVLHYGASGKGLTLWGLMQYHYSNFKLFKKFGHSEFSAGIIFILWLITRTIYSLISMLVFKESIVNYSRIKLYLKAMIWYLSLGRLKFSITYK